MSERYKQVASTVSEAHFSKSANSPLEFSRMAPVARTMTTFKGGQLVPIRSIEVLPSETLDVRADFVIRMTTMIHPFFGELYADIYAFFEPHRVANRSFVNVMGENSAGAGIAPDVELAPLVMPSGSNSSYTIPVGSVADYYGFPTQAPIPRANLVGCNDLKFRGYVDIWNEFFRDQNYQPAIPVSKLNVFEGFFETAGDSIPLADGTVTLGPGEVSTSGSFGSGSLAKEVYGEGGVNLPSGSAVNSRSLVWSALQEPLPVNKLHDFFTSHLPYPMKGASLSFLFPSSTTNVNVIAGGNTMHSTMGGVKFAPSSTSGLATNQAYSLGFYNSSLPSSNGNVGVSPADTQTGTQPSNVIGQTNLIVSLSPGSLGQLDIAQMRTAVATQRLYEALARGGSRYHELCFALFGIEVDDPYRDRPEFLGHIRRTLNNYQVAQTSQSVEGANPQGNLAAYSYTADGGHLFTKTFLEHGYVHIFAVVRQKNIYSTLLWKDNFRRGFLDFYFPELANISEQPTYLRTLNPFSSNGSTQVMGYQEAWSELRYEPDMATGLFRSGTEGSLSTWALMDPYDADQGIIDGAFMQSNLNDVLKNVLAFSPESEPPFFGEFAFIIDKTLPLPVYSVPGLDVF